MKKHYGPRLRVLHCCTDQAITNALAQMELTAAQGRILGFLARCPTVSGLLARLEKKEFIALRSDPDDRRCKRIWILEKGEVCNQHMQKTIEGIEQRLVQDFTREEQALFTGLLDRAITNMGGTYRRCHK